MSTDRLSQMTDHAACVLLDQNAPVTDLPATLARAWPKAAALELGVAIACACDAIERMYQPQDAIFARVMQGWRLSALVGGDVLALQALRRPHETAADLLAWWQTAERA
jgi:thiosulfate reductase cytochrome b subunit